jgi:hypothetical protein
LPLVLSLKRGQDFFVGEDCFVIDAVLSETQFRLRHSATGRSFEVDDTKSTEIMPDVFVSAGEKPLATMARVAIEAPQEILILRGDRKRQPSVP